MKNATHRILENMKAALGDIYHDPEKCLGELKALYHPDFTFQDPLQNIKGWDAFADMNRRLVARAKKLHFHISDISGDGDLGFMTWSLSMDFRRMPAMVMEGMSHFTVKDGLVIKHRDYWDLLGTIMESLPVAPIYKRLVARLA